MRPTHLLTLAFLFLLTPYTPLSAALKDGKLDSRAAYALRELDRPLTAAERALKADQPARAAELVEQIEQILKQTRENYGLPKKNDKVRAVLDRLAAIKKGIGSQQDSHAGDEADLPRLMPALRDSRQRLDQAIRAVRGMMSQYSNARATYSRDRKTSQFQPINRQTTVLAQRVQDVLPDAVAAAAAFRQRFDNPYQLGRRIPEARDASELLGSIDSLAEDWELFRKSYCDEYLDEAQTLITRHEKALAAADGDRGKTVADAAEAQVVRYSAALLEAVLALHPEETHERKQRALSLSAKIDQVAASVARLRGEAAQAETLRLAEARFPETELKGGKWDQVGERMTKAWSAFAPGEKVVQVAVSSPWDQRTEARWRDRWIIGTYDYVRGFVAVELPNGIVRVHSISFREEIHDDGSRGPFQVFGVGSSYRMLQQHL